MKKIFQLTLLAFLVLSGSFAQTDRSNTTTLADCIQEFSTAVNGYYGTRVLRVSQGMTMATIEKYMASWKANRCLWRGICLANETDFNYIADVNRYRLTITLLKGKAHLDFAQNKQGLFRFVAYQTEGNINSCPVGQTPTNTFYANVDLVGEWYFKDISWHQYPAALRGAMAVSQAALKADLEERIKNLSDPYLKSSIGVVVFEANGKGKFVTLDGEKPFQWRLQYNQLQINDTGEWKVMSWKIDKDGNFNLIDTDWGGSSGEPRFVYARK
ncbi:MAG: hypothetical protein OHK0045_02210 [Raineya sp.]